MNVAMWAKALQVIPRLSKDEWLTLDVISRWLVATRSAVLVITFISALIAGILAFRDGRLEWPLWLLLAVGLVMSHATNNLVNDLVDSWKGVDRGDDAFRAQYGPQPLEHGLMTVRGMLLYAAVTGLVALGAGLALVVARGGLTLPLLGIGVFFVLFYTWPLKHIGLGEVAVLVVWGPLMVGGGYYVITGEWQWDIVLASLPYALGATTVIFGKHIDKIRGDRIKGVRTLPVIIGERAARYSAVFMMILQYGLTVYLILSGFFTAVMLVVFLALRRLSLVLKVYSQPRPVQPPPEYPAEGWPLWFVAFAFWHNRTFGSLYVLGLFLDALLVRVALS